MSKQKIIDISFGISSIKTLKFMIENIEQATKIDKATLEFNISVAMFVDPQKEIIGFNVIIDIFLDKNKTLKVSELITQVVYHIVNFDEVIKPNIDKIGLDIPNQFITTLISIALSTSRGIFAAKTEGSVLDGVYMPIVDPKAFLAL